MDSHRSVRLGAQYRVFKTSIKCYLVRRKINFKLKLKLKIFYLTTGLMENHTISSKYEPWQLDVKKRIPVEMKKLIKPYCPKRVAFGLGIPSAIV